MPWRARVKSKGLYQDPWSWPGAIDLDEIPDVPVDLPGFKEECIVTIAALHELELDLQACFGEGLAELRHVGGGNQEVRVDREQQHPG